MGRGQVVKGDHGDITVFIILTVMIVLPPGRMSKLTVHFKCVDFTACQTYLD